ncbi:MAG: HlyD family efflux transporter periplasmic adaptor subunit [Gemmatimonadetes bacterium]|nr:HlyD family efflux transporter periplasmic adaptor subunit [Gemmatimonadota bacterium]
MTNRLRWIVGLSLVGFVAAIAWWLRPEPLALDLAVAVRGPLRQSLHAEGKTRVRDRYVVAAPVTGRLDRTHVRVGDSVVAGAVLASLAPTPLDLRSRRQAEAQVAALEDACRSATAQVRAAAAALEQARRERLRADSLAAGGHIAAAGREAAQLQETTRARELEGAEARAETAEHDLERARAALAAAGVEQGGGPRTVLRAPVAGRVLLLLEESDRVILAGTPVLELGDVSRLEIVSDLLTTEAVLVRPGDTVLVEGWGGDSALLARVRRVEPSGFTKVSALGVEEQRVNMVADLDRVPPELGDRFRVEVRIVLWGAADVLTIPESALVRDGEGWVVYQVVDGRLRRQPVTVGHVGGFAVEIRSGLEPGDVVVRHPGAGVVEGVRVRAAGGAAT